ncbi:STM4012 family radical SAM protein [Pleionea sp. CnH1-48]|uniref:STM4012 family radical SAM protein n=1 Tax=Pleionea sp. CnH1-48 TaxID=2954494 RepID=UPI002097311D|nr:STM4012 family radical SAM protein [Pleionea sp. CnH1-48]MCO7225102.1 STM4012 family radical SAM protein [Pleionea sp. CnH1-48]
MKYPASFPKQIYQAYSYSYPHKTAYRHFEHPIPLKDVWQSEKKDALFLYLHIPFCEMRCGFCNLFTISKPNNNLVESYLSSLRLQIQAMKTALGSHQFVRFAIGGGTPTFLSATDINTLYEDIHQHLNLVDAIPTSIETSPETISQDHLRVFENYDVQRVSIGVQSFSERELKALIRPQKLQQVDQALKMIKASNIPIMNLDLIYGAPGQTLNSWQATLEHALSYAPEEVYLYPLYEREKTGMDTVKQRGKSSLLSPAQEEKRALYRYAREQLLLNNYEQISMRMFRKKALNLHEGPVYCCQSDGMVGIGAGARSYTQNIHYCSEYGVSRSSVKSIIEDYTQLTQSDFEQAPYGFHLSEQEQKRRFLMQSLLLKQGFNLSDYYQRFSTQALDDFDQLDQLLETDLAERHDNHLMLTDTGLELSDAIGPWFVSDKVNQLMQEYSVL